MVIKISVKNRVATYLHTEEAPVCGNSSDQVKFLFDEEWNAHEKKTARFFWGNQFHDELFEGDTCPIPMFIQTNRIQIGVYVGVPLEGRASLASTRATVPYLTSVHCTEARPTSESVEGYVHEAKEAAQESEEWANLAQTALDEINVVIESTTNTAAFAREEAAEANAEATAAKAQADAALRSASEARRASLAAESAATAANTAATAATETATAATETANTASEVANGVSAIATEAKELALAAQGLHEVGSLTYALDTVTGFRITGTTSENRALQAIYRHRRFYDNEVNQQVDREEFYVPGLKELLDTSKFVKLALFYNNYNNGVRDIPLFSEWITDRTTTCAVDDFGVGESLTPGLPFTEAAPSKSGTKIYECHYENLSTDTKSEYVALWLSELVLGEYTAAMNLGCGSFDGYVTFTGYN